MWLNLSGASKMAGQEDSSPRDSSHSTLSLNWKLWGHIGMMSNIQIHGSRLFCWFETPCVIKLSTINCSSDRTLSFAGTSFIFIFKVTENCCILSVHHLSHCYTFISHSQLLEIWTWICLQFFFPQIKYCAQTKKRFAFFEWTHPWMWRRWSLMFSSSS